MAAFELAIAQRRFFFLGDHRPESSHIPPEKQPQESPDPGVLLPDS